MHIFHFEQKNACPLLQGIQPNVSAQLSCSLLDNWALLYDDYNFTLEMKSQPPIAENGYLTVYIKDRIFTDESCDHGIIDSASNKVGVYRIPQ